MSDCDYLNYYEKLESNFKSIFKEEYTLNNVKKYH